MRIADNRFLPVQGPLQLKSRHIPTGISTGTESVPHFTGFSNRRNVSLVARLSAFLSLVTAFSIPNFSANRKEVDFPPERSKVVQKEPEVMAARVPRLPSENNGWNRNVRVMAAVGQDYKASYNNSGGDYTRALLNRLRSGDFSGLEAAHNNMERRGYRMSPFSPRTYSPSTPNQLSSWRLDNTRVPRFALLLGQIEKVHDEMPGKEKSRARGFNIGVRADLNNMERVLRDRRYYNLPSRNVMRLDNASYEDVREGIRWLQQKARENPGAEIMIYYSGHGDTSLPLPDDREGDARGYLNGPWLGEQTLKKWVNTYLAPEINEEGPPKVLIIVDACYAGAMVARYEPEPDERNRLFTWPTLASFQLSPDLVTD